VRGTRRQAHWIANGCHQRNIWQGELSKQNSAEAKSEGNKRAAGSKYNQSEISHEFPRDLSAEHYALPHRTIICASGALFLHVRHEFCYFKYENSCFLLNHQSHKIVANKTYCAYYFSKQVDDRLRAQVSATMSILPLHKPAFDLEATQRRALNAIVTQTSVELPTHRSNKCSEALRDGRG
jgi:hypothetical protein